MAFLEPELKRFKTMTSDPVTAEVLRFDKGLKGPKGAAPVTISLDSSPIKIFTPSPVRQSKRVKKEVSNKNGCKDTAVRESG